jgi:hypothetical protein
LTQLRHRSFYPFISCSFPLLRTCHLVPVAPNIRATGPGVDAGQAGSLPPWVTGCSCAKGVFALSGRRVTLLLLQINLRAASWRRMTGTFPSAPIRF